METPNLPAIRALRPVCSKGRVLGKKAPTETKTSEFALSLLAPIAILHSATWQSTASFAAVIW